MHLIAPDLLAEARGLSIGVCSTGVGIGLFLWLFGWRWHRFWTVVAVTVGAGLYGLSIGQAANGQMLVLGLLLAVSAGLLALEIARILAFLAGGTATWMAALALAPEMKEPWVFLAGGLVGVFFYRLWMMALTSFVGSLITGHSALVLIEGTSPFDAGTWAAQNSLALSVAVGLGTVLGIALQAAQERRRTDETIETERRGRFRRFRRQRKTNDSTLPPDMQKLRDAFSK